MSDLVQPTLGVKSRFKFLDVFSGSSPPEISVPDNNEITRFTVGRVKPLLDLHRICACDAIRFGLGDNSQFQKVSLPLSFNTSLMLGTWAYIIISELGTPH